MFNDVFLLSSPDLWSVPGERTAVSVMKQNSIRVLRGFEHLRCSSSRKTAWQQFRAAPIKSYVNVQSHQFTGGCSECGSELWYNWNLPQTNKTSKHDSVILRGGSRVISMQRAQAACCIIHDSRTESSINPVYSCSLIFIHQRTPTPPTYTFTGNENKNHVIWFIIMS